MSFDPKQVETVFAEALAKPAAERPAFLRTASGVDSSIRQRVEALLEAYAASSGFLDVPAAALAGVMEVTETAPGDSGPLAFLAPPLRQDSLGRLAHYEILEVIGEGGFGTVLKAFDDKLHRMVAIKVLSPELSASAQARSRFIREARAAAAVSHEHLVTLHAVEADHQPPYLVMQLIDGVTLEQKLEKESALGLKETLRIGLQIAQGLAAAHKHGLVHRDIKPANVLLENAIELVKITDFGLARTVDDSGVLQSSVLIGTPAFMSPEQADGLPIDHRSDLFSLGTVLYLMCTGRPPFSMEGSMATLRRVVEETPPPIRQIDAELPEWLEAIITKLHAKKPQDRYQSAREVAEVLEKHLAGVQADGATWSAGVSPVQGDRNVRVRASSPTFPGSPARWLVAGVVVLVLAGTGYFIWHNFLATHSNGGNGAGGAKAPPLAVAPYDAKEAKAHQEAWAKHLGVSVEIEDSLGMKLRLIPPGKYLMGTDDATVAKLVAAAELDLVKQAFETEALPREVTIAKPFYLGVHEVTVREFRAFVADTKHRTQAELEGGGRDWEFPRTPFQDPALDWRKPGPPSGDSWPVTQVSPADIGAFVDWLSRKDDHVYRLPTEEEWEYACRAGTQTLYAFGDELDATKRIVYRGLPNVKGPVPVGTTWRNPFGLCEMHGNVVELCTSTRTPGRLAIRGGSFMSYYTLVRSAARLPALDTSWASSHGFRVVRELK